MDKNNLLKLANNKDEKLLISRLVDIYEDALKHGFVKSGKFLTGREQNLAKHIFSSFKVDYALYGGYDEAERKIPICYSDEVFVDIFKPPVVILNIECKFGDQLNHRDYLGALMGLGIKRELFGDILCDENGAKIFVLEEIADYVKQQLDQVGRYGVTVNICDTDDIVIPPKKFKDLSFTVNSLRLDGIVSGCTGESRSVSANLIEGGNVTVNWEEILNVSKNIEINDIISIKGYGRFVLSEIGGQTRKGRTFLNFKKYI